MLIRFLLLTCLLFPLELIAAPCEVLAKVSQVEVRETGPECKDIVLVVVARDGTSIGSMRYEEIPQGLERFWVQSCDCYLWQVSGIGGAHTRIVRFFRENSASALVEIKGGVFGSEIGRISRSYRNKDLYVEVQDSVAGTNRLSTTRYRLRGDRFVKSDAPRT
ncbi:MAG TPA: hypothetical protein VK165_16705 [Azonexus sp.]|nr:hypothetical protein [Azonexus sp.]